MTVARRRPTGPRGQGRWRPWPARRSVATAARVEAAEPTRSAIPLPVVDVQTALVEHLASAVEIMAADLRCGPREAAVLVAQALLQLPEVRGATLH